MPELPLIFADGRLPPRFLPKDRPVIARAAGGCPSPNDCRAVMATPGEPATASCTRCQMEHAGEVSGSETTS